MKAHPGKKYTVSQVNNYPTGVPAVGIISTLFFATLTDFMGGRRYIGKYSLHSSMLTELNLSSWLLDRHHRRNYQCTHPSIPAQHVYSFWHVLLGRQRVCLSSNILRLGE